MTNFRNPPLRDRKYLDAYAGQTCISCGIQDGTIVGAHIRHGHGGGMGMKPDDSLTLPLCFECHDQQGRVTEIPFWWDVLNNRRYIAEELMMSALKALARERYAQYLEER